MDVLTLLRSKNRCLEKFLSLSVDFLESTRESATNLLQDELQEFQVRREATLKAMDLYDRKVSETVASLSDAARTPALIEAVRSSLARKEELVHQILDVDLQIMTRIEEAKNGLLKELATSRKSKALLGKFKSNWAGGESGEELDEKL